MSGLALVALFSPRRTIPTKSLGIEDPPLTHAATRTPPGPLFHGSGAVAFSTKGEYGVRLMVQLGRHFGPGPASLAEIAAEEDLPRAYLEQLVMSLRDAGLVVSTRGAHGGYELARPPADIRMSEVLRALEGPIAPMICAPRTRSTRWSATAASRAPSTSCGSASATRSPATLEVDDPRRPRPAATSPIDVSPPTTASVTQSRPHR